LLSLLEKPWRPFDCLLENLSLLSLPLGFFLPRVDPYQDILFNVSSQATAAVSQLGSSVNELEKESLDDVFGLLRSKAVSWNEPGSAQFDFRSPLPLLFSSFNFISTFALDLDIKTAPLLTYVTQAM
jgi:hypothetical protein